MTRAILDRLRKARGQALVEAALITPLLLLLTCAVVDFSSILYVWLTLENGVSQAARYAVTGNGWPDPARPGETLSRLDSIKAAMRANTPTLTIPDDAFTLSHLPAGGTTWVDGPGGPGEIGKVSVNYTWNVLTPLLQPFFARGQVHLTVESAMKDEPRFR